MSLPAQDPKNIDDLLQAGRRRPPQPPAAATPPGAPRPPVASPAEPPEPQPTIVRGTFQLTQQNDQFLHQLSYHTPGRRGDKSFIINEALSEYFAKRPKCQEAIPEEDAVRRRGRRHH